MIFFCDLPHETVFDESEMTLKELSERELIEQRIAAASRVRRKRLILKLGFATIRRKLRHRMRSTTPWRMWRGQWQRPWQS